MGKRYQKHHVFPLEGNDMDAFIKKVRKDYEPQEKRHNVEIFAKGKYVYVIESEKLLRGHTFCYCCAKFYKNDELEVKQAEDWRARKYEKFECPKCGNEVKKRRIG